MRKWLIPLLLLASTVLAHADSLVVQACGTLPLAYAPGATRNDTIDVNGNKCVSGGGGGGGAVTQSGNWYIGTYTLNTFSQPTVTASSAYVSGNVVGGLLTFTNSARSAGSTGMLTGATLNFASAQTAAFDLYIFERNPTNSTFTDKTALSINTADINKLIKVIHIADCTNGGTPSICQADNIGKNYSTVNDANLYGVLVTRGTPTFGATNDLMVRIYGTEN